MTGDAPLPWAESGPSVLGPVLLVGEQLAVRRLPRPVGWRAPVYVEDDVSWPPAVTPATRWHVVVVREGKHSSRTALREVGLWDARVLVADERRVFCPTCCELVEVVELGRDLFRGQDGVLGGGTPKHTLRMPPLPATTS